MLENIVREGNSKRGWSARGIMSENIVRERSSMRGIVRMQLERNSNLGNDAREWSRRGIK